MKNYATSFIELIDRESIDLSADDRDSLNYYYASVNIAEGLPVDSPERRWCAMAQDVGRIAHMLGRLPRSGDPGATAEIVEWISKQSVETLNAFQRAWLGSLPGYET